MCSGASAGAWGTPMKIRHSRTDVGATGRSPARGHGCGRPAGGRPAGGRPAGRPYEDFHPQWRTAGSRKLGGDRTPRITETIYGCHEMALTGSRQSQLFLKITNLKSPITDNKFRD